jgi:hypothetical protein
VGVGAGAFATVGVGIDVGVLDFAGCALSLLNAM